VREVLEHCLAPDKANRYKNAGELARALRRASITVLALAAAADWGVGKFIWKWPVLSGVVAGLVPNAMTAKFNLEYNRARIGESWPDLSKPFEKSQLIINCIAFTIGILGGGWMTVRAVRFVKNKVTEPRPDGSGKVLAFSCRSRCLC